MKNITLIAWLLLPSLSFGQTTAYVRATPGNYWMNDMKENQEEFKTDLLDSEIPAKTTSSFPVSLQGEAGVDFTIYDRLLRKYQLGGFLNYTVTRGRISYADYSGSLNVTHHLKRTAIGVKGIWGIRDNLAIYTKAAWCFSRLEIQYVISLQGVQANDETYEFTASGIALEPGIQWTKTFERLTFMVHGGYELNLNGKTMYGEESYMIDSVGQPVFVDWSGFRLGIGVGISLKGSS